MKSALSLGLLALVLATASCVRKWPPPKTACCPAETTPLSPKGKPGAWSDRSLYQVESVWTNDAGQTTTLADLRGRPQVITLFFASCEYACPVLVYDLQRIEKALPEAVRAEVGFTLVSIDPERDTPDALQKYRDNRNLDARWNLWTGNADDVLELAALLGVKFKKDARGQFAHSNLITLLNADGEMVHQQIGLNQNPAAMVSAVQKLRRAP